MPYRRLALLSALSLVLSAAPGAFDGMPGSGGVQAQDSFDQCFDRCVEEFNLCMGTPDPAPIPEPLPNGDPSVVPTPPPVEFCLATHQVCTAECNLQRFEEPTE